MAYTPETLQKPKTDPTPAGALDDIKTFLNGKLKVYEQVGEDLKKLKDDFGSLENKEKLKRIGGIIAVAFLGLFMDKKEMAAYRNQDRKDIRVTESDSDQAATYRPDKELVMVSPSTILAPKNKHSPEKNKIKVKMREHLANMTPAADDYYKENGDLTEKTKAALNSGAMNIEQIPNKVVLSGSSELFSDMPKDYESFENRLTSTLYPHVMDKERAVNQSAYILSKCALGRFQILPKFHFEKMGWQTKGREGLKDMYKFLCSPENQKELFLKIVDSLMKKNNNDPVLVAIEYYGGAGKVAKYKENPSSESLSKGQFKGHGSVNAYANRMKEEYAKVNSSHFTENQKIAIALEKIESGGTSIIDSLS